MWLRPSPAPSMGRARPSEGTLSEERQNLRRRLELAPGAGASNSTTGPRASVTSVDGNGLGGTISVLDAATNTVFVITTLGGAPARRSVAPGGGARRQPLRPARLPSSASSTRAPVSRPRVAPPPQRQQRNEGALWRAEKNSSARRTWVPPPAKLRSKEIKRVRQSSRSWLKW